MSKKPGYIKRTLDRRREERAVSSRVYDKDLAWDMALAEKPYRESASLQSKVGNAVLKDFWTKYPNVRNNAIVSAVHISRRTQGEVSPEQASRVVRYGIGLYAESYDKKQPMSLSDWAYNRREAKIQAIMDINPSEIPYRDAQGIGYALLDSAKVTIENGVAAAQNLQNKAEGIVVQFPSQQR